MENLLQPQFISKSNQKPVIINKIMDNDIHKNDNIIQMKTFIDKVNFDELTKHDDYDPSMNLNDMIDSIQEVKTKQKKIIPKNDSSIINYFIVSALISSMFLLFNYFFNKSLTTLKLILFTIIFFTLTFIIIYFYFNK